MTGSSLAFAPRPRRHPPIGAAELTQIISDGQKKGRTLWEIARKENYRGLTLQRVHEAVLASLSTGGAG